MAYLVPTGLVSAPVSGRLIPPGLLSIVSTVADVVQYVTPRTFFEGASPTINPSTLTGSGNVAEVVGAPNTLSELNASVNATTGVITFGVGGATPVGTYVIWLARNGGDTFVLTIHVVAATSGRGGGFFRVGLGQSAFGKSAFRRGFR